MYQPYGGGPPRRERPVWPWILLGVVVAVIVVTLLYIFYYAPPPSASGRPYFGYWGGFFLIFIMIWVAFFALRMALWTSWRSRNGGNRGGGRGDPAVFAARQRYARGEITREQFNQIMVDLGRRPPGPPGSYPPP